MHYGGMATTMVYGMGDFLQQCVDTYRTLAATVGPAPKLRRVVTPFLGDDSSLSPQGAPAATGPIVECPWCKHTYPPPPVYNNLRELDASTRKKPSSGSKATSSSKKSGPESWDSKGNLACIASKVLMKVLWAARLARYDLLKAVSYLARFVTRWSTRCDEMLHRLMCYIDSTKHHRMVSWVGDPLSKCFHTSSLALILLGIP